MDTSSPFPLAHTVTHRDSCILVIDDDPFILETIKIILENQGVKTVLASGAVEAQEILDRMGYTTFDCVLTDVQMPGESGLHFFSKIVKQDPSLTTIIITSDDQKETVTQALRMGVYDFIEKPFRPQDIRNIVQKAIERTADLRNLNETVSEVKEVALIHQKLLRVAHTPYVIAENKQKDTVQMRTCLFPIRETGGDFFNYYELEESQFFVQAGDVSGHDLKAGFISAYFQGIVHGMVEMKANMEKICNSFNRFLTLDWNTRQYDQDILTSLACSFVLINLDRRELSVLSHGFPLARVALPDLEVSIVGELGAPFGWFHPLEINPVIKNISQNGTCYLWSDGLEDCARHMNVSPFTLAYYLLKNDELEVKKILQKYQRDDIMLIQARWDQTKETFAISSEEAYFLEPLFHAIYPGNAASQIDSFEDTWSSSLRYIFPSLPHSKLKEILLCCREAVLNALLHGCLESMEKSCSLAMGLDEKENRLLLRIDDGGHGYENYPKPVALDEIEGDHVPMGLTIIRSYAQKIITARNGSTLLIYFDLSS